MRRLFIGLLACAALGGCQSGVIDAGSSGTPSSDAGAKEDAGPTPVLLASLIQIPPTGLASDGTSVYWVSPVTATTASLYSVPVAGGNVQTILDGIATNNSGSPGVLSVDDTNVYVFTDTAVGPARIPKNGSGTPTAMGVGYVFNTAFQIVGSAFEWLAQDPTNTTDYVVDLKNTLLKGGSTSQSPQFISLQNETPVFGVTSTKMLISTAFSMVVMIPLDSGNALPSIFGAPDAGNGLNDVVTGDECSVMASDPSANAVYCITENSSTLLRIDDSGTVTTLANLFDAPNIAFDDTYVYWVDNLTVGTIMRVPKIGGNPTVLARDTNPFTVAVDAMYVYWSDQGGNIWRLAK